jgi:hypothetical protein
MILVISASLLCNLFSLAQVIRASLHQTLNQHLLIHRCGLTEVQDTLRALPAAHLRLCSCMEEFVGGDSDLVDKLDNDVGSQGVFAHYNELV